jgi:predicted AlkP superfamily pyrophosphatase or phosphodiesterase
MKRPIRALACLISAVLVAAGCAGAPPAATQAAGKPRLVVFLVVDGLPQRQVVDYREQLAPDGMRRFLDRGGWFSNAHYGHAYTVTGAGHATMLTGAYPHRTGIIGNEWRDPATGQMEYCAGDVSATYIGHKTNKLDGTSPKNLRVETVGDVLKRVDVRSKVVAISGKDRGAILPAGKRGIAYMYQAQTGQFASSTFYMQDHPQWVKDFHAAKPADAYFKREWKPLLADSAYAKSLPDEQKWYAKGGKLPKKLGEGQDRPGPLFYGSLLATPFGDEFTLDFARAALAGEQLGRDDAPDILIVSLSGHDYINHAFGAESRLSHDHLLQVDRLLQGFFRDLDTTIGKDNYVAVLTADHGFMPAPEYSLSLGRDAGRQSGGEMLARVNATLARKYGEGQWILYVSALGLVFNKPLIAQKQIDAHAFAEDARTALLADEGIAVAYTRAELESGSRAGAPFFEAIRKTWHRELSGDVQFALKPYWMTSSSSNMTTHGSPHAYDTHVPLLFYGPKWVKPGRIDTRVEIVDIAPTLAAMLDVPPPSASEGKLLPLKAPGS